MIVDSIEIEMTTSTSKRIMRSIENDLFHLLVPVKGILSLKYLTS